MTTVILDWAKEPTTAFKFSLDEDKMSGEYGAIQRDILPLVSSTPGLKFVFQGARFVIEDRSAILAVIESIRKGGHTVENKGDVPPEIEAPAPGL